MRSMPGGKGSARRPTLINTEEADARWEAIFGKKKEHKEVCKNNCPGCTCKFKTEVIGGPVSEFTP